MSGLIARAAVVISRLDAAPKTRKAVVRFEAVGTALRGHDSWLGRDDFPNMAMNDAAAMMWERTDLKPKDVSTAHLYDGVHARRRFVVDAEVALRIFANLDDVLSDCFTPLERVAAVDSKV